MNANPGDLVACVVAGPLNIGGAGAGHGLGLRMGAVYKVVSCGLSQLDGLPVYHLSPETGWCGSYQARFRKLNDSNDDAELIERIKSCKPAKEPAAPRARSEAAVGEGL